MRYLLDTNVVIDYLNKRPRATELVDSLSIQGHVLCTCAVVVAEVYAGILPRSSSAERAQTLLDALTFLPTEADAGREAGEWRYQFARQGMQLATQDSLIAATAFQHDATVLTGNERHFPMPEVSVLKLEH